MPPTQLGGDNVSAICLWRDHRRRHNDEIVVSLRFVTNKVFRLAIPLSEAQHAIIIVIVIEDPRD